MMPIRWLFFFDICWSYLETTVDAAVWKHLNQSKVPIGFFLAGVS